MRTEYCSVVFLRDSIGRICLARKKEDIHKTDGEALKGSATLNGYGGRFEPSDRNILATAIRELKEESGVVGREDDLEFVARIRFFWPGKDEPDMDVSFFLLGRYDGEPAEMPAGKMGPPFFYPADPDTFPYKEMMPADEFFMRKVLSGICISADVRFGADKTVEFIPRGPELELPDVPA